MVDTDLHHTGVQIYRRLLGYVRPYWRVFLIGVVAMIAFAATDTGFAALMKPLLDESLIARDPAAIGLIPLLLLGLFLVRAIAAFFAAYCVNWVGRRVIKDLRRGMFDRLLVLPTSHYDRTSSGTLLSKMTFDVEQVSQAATTTITVVIQDTLTMLFLLALMLYYSWQLTLVFVVVGPIIAGLVLYVSKRFRRISHRIQASMGDITHVTEENIEGHRVVKTFGGQEWEARQFERANERNRQQRMKMEVARALSDGVIQLMGAAGLAAVIYIATHGAVLESMTAGKFVAMVTALILLQKPIKRLTTVNSQLQRGIAAAQSVFALIDNQAESDAGTLSLARARGRIEYQQVCFSYAADKGEVLADIDLIVEPGQTLAVVGRSGSGKSTLVNLLARFYEVSSGRILLDGHDLREIRLQSLRDQIALVSQNVTLFNDTVANNIAYGRLAGSSAAEIKRAAIMAHAEEFISRLPQGLDTLVGENGIMLSGGQRQRLAIARALLKDAPILILDEATSALDTESERHIQEALQELMQNRTTLVIAHRLSTVEKADKIVVLHEGRIVEAGTHRELLGRGGHYASLHKLQFREPAVASA